jgi:hypothetical protein
MTTLEGANYSVTLDGITTALSARSLFLVPDTTLFFATGLNDSVHSVEVTNNGGKLSLLEDGFRTVEASSGSGGYVSLIWLFGTSFDYPFLHCMS